MTHAVFVLDAIAVCIVVVAAGDVAVVTIDPGCCSCPRSDAASVVFIPADCWCCCSSSKFAVQQPSVVE